MTFFELFKKLLPAGFVLLSLEVYSKPIFSPSAQSVVNRNLNGANIPPSERSKDILFLFSDKQAPLTGTLAEVMDLKSPERKQLEAVFRIVHCELDLSRGDYTSLPFILAEKFGIQGTPSLYLSDSSLQPYAHFLGNIRSGVRKAEFVSQLISYQAKKKQRDSLMTQSESASGEVKQRLLLQALAQVPAEVRPGCYPEIISQLTGASPEVLEAKNSLLEYNNSQAKYVMAMEWPSPSTATKETIENYLSKINTYLKQENLSLEIRVYVLLNYRFPLLVKKAKFKAEEKQPGVFSAESDRLIREALNDLNYIIRHSPDTSLKNEAFHLRKEISAERRKLP